MQNADCLKELSWEVCGFCTGGQRCEPGPRRFCVPSPGPAGFAFPAPARSEQPLQHRPLRAPLLTGQLEVVVQRPGVGALRSLLEGSSEKAEAGAEIRMSTTGKDVY